MIQEIAPHRLDNHYAPRAPAAGDRLVAFREDRVLLQNGALPQWAGQTAVRYLFEVDGAAWFLAESETLPEGQWTAMNRRALPGDPVLAFGIATAKQLAEWYGDHRFCGRCGGPMAEDSRERHLVCARCGCGVYPTICPGVIVAVRDGERLLLTKYAGRAYTRYALVAGFTEIGETAEETAAREVWEETGLHIKNIRFYKSQPWAFSSSLLLGFTAELDGSPAITLDCGELSEAGWFRREEIDFTDDGVSLTGEMIRRFMDGRWE